MAEGFFSSSDSENGKNKLLEEKSNLKGSGPIEKSDLNNEEDNNNLTEFVRKYIKIDNNIRDLKSKIKPINIQIKELNLQKKQLSLVIANIMATNNIDTLEPEINQKAMGKLIYISSQRSTPTLAAIKETLFLELGKNDQKFKIFMDKALKNSKTPIPTIRRTLPKKKN